MLGGGTPLLNEMSNTSVEISLTEGIDSNGKPKVVSTWEGKGHYCERVRNEQMDDGVNTVSESFIMVEGDIAPDLEVLEGSVAVAEMSQTFKIGKSSRPKLPGGQVIYTKLELR
jgi:hypothetical protein